MRVSHELTVPAGADEVWRALTDADLVRRWNFDMTVASDWRPGATVSYSWAPGAEAESGVVVEAEPGRRLVLETRFLFDAEISAEPAHRTAWELTPAGSGTMLKVDYDVPDEARVAAKLLADDGELTLRGLRLLLDPEARAELKRLPAIGPVEVRDLMPELAGDYQRFFDVDGFRDHPAWAACYCSETNIGESVARSGRENRTLMTRLIEAGKVTALMAYVDGRPVGWCNYGLTTQLAGVMSKLKLEAADHDGVGSVACFVISPPYRRHGIAELLLEAACERLKARGCRAVEAYPRKESDDATSYRGPLGMFLGAGFEPYRVAGRTQIVRKSLL